MNWNLIWIYILVLQMCYVSSQPVPEAASPHTDQHIHRGRSSSHEHTDTQNDEKVISVRITSSVAVARGNSKPTRTDNEQNLPSNSVKNELAVKNMTETMENEEEQEPPNHRGANIEYLKQLHAKKEPHQLSLEQDFETSALRYDDEERMPESKNDQTNTKRNKGDAITSKILSSDDFNGFRSKSLSILDEALKLADDRLNPNITDELTEAEPSTENVYLSTFYEEEYSGEDKSGFNFSDSKESRETDDSLAESSIKSVLEIAKQDEDFENVPLARSLHAQASKNYIQSSRYKPPNEIESSTRLTTISFSIVHDAPKAPSFNEQKPYSNPTQYQEHKLYETPTIYSQPAKIYSEPAQIYSEPAKVYSEPAKIYSEPAKIYSEPAKVYSEPAKFYSQPASLHLQPNPTNNSPLPVQWQPQTTVRTTSTEPAQTAENNYEIDEKVSVLTDGRSHGVQEATTEKCKQDSCKVGYVFKGRQFNKYRVEERTADGFIVGEYGVVRNEDGALRGVRYTADSEASPRLIYDALMKFLQLK